MQVAPRLAKIVTGVAHVLAGVSTVGGGVPEVLASVRPVRLYIGRDVPGSFAVGAGLGQVLPRLGRERIGAGGVPVLRRCVSNPKTGRRVSRHPVAGLTAFRVV
jgi:hypothetical protein